MSSDWYEARVKECGTKINNWTLELKDCIEKCWKNPQSLHRHKMVLESFMEYIGIITQIDRNKLDFASVDDQAIINITTQINKIQRDIMLGIYEDLKYEKNENLLLRKFIDDFISNESKKLNIHEYNLQLAPTQLLSNCLDELENSCKKFIDNPDFSELSKKTIEAIEQFREQVTQLATKISKYKMAVSHHLINAVKDIVEMNNRLKAEKLKLSSDKTSQILEQRILLDRIEKNEEKLQQLAEANSKYRHQLRNILKKLREQQSISTPSTTSRKKLTSGHLESLLTKDSSPYVDPEFKPSCLDNKLIQKKMKTVKIPQQQIETNVEQEIVEPTSKHQSPIVEQDDIEKIYSVYDYGDTDYTIVDPSIYEEEQTKKKKNPIVVDLQLKRGKQSKTQLPISTVKFQYPQ